MHNLNRAIYSNWVETATPTTFARLVQLCPLLFWHVNIFFSRTNKLGFTPEFLGRVKLVTSIASLLGVGLYNGFLKNVPLRKIFLGTTVAGTALGLTQVLLDLVCIIDHTLMLHNLLIGISHAVGYSRDWFKSKVWYKWWVVCNWGFFDHNSSWSGNFVKLMPILLFWTASY